MDFQNFMTVTSLQVYETDFQKSELLYVPARPFHSLTFRCGGRITLETEGVSLLSETDCITYVPAGIAYRSQILESGHMTAVHFEVLQKDTGWQPQVIRPRDPEAFGRLFAALAEGYPGNPQDYMSMALFYEILGTLAFESTAQLPGGSRRMNEAKQYIDKNYGSRELSVGFLAEQAGISQVHFRKVFREQFGMAPLAYIRSLRLKNAKTLLKTGYYTVTETAEKCGFDSLSYFCSEFHRFTGTTPGEYLKKYNR